MILYGDLIYNTYTITDLSKGGSCVVIDSKDRFKSEEIGVTIADEAVTNFAYGLPTKWSHIIYMTENESSFFKKLCADRKRNKMYPFEIFNHMISKGFKFKAIEPSGMNIREIDSMKDL